MSIVHDVLSTCRLAEGVEDNEFVKIITEILSKFGIKAKRDRFVDVEDDYAYYEGKTDLNIVLDIGKTGDGYELNNFYMAVPSKFRTGSKDEQTISKVVSSVEMGFLNTPEPDRTKFISSVMKAIVSYLRMMRKNVKKELSGFDFKTTGQ